MSINSAIQKIKLFFFIFSIFWVNSPAFGSVPDHGDPLLNSYLAMAAENNPELKAEFFHWKAELEKVTQANSLPDPILSFAYFINEVETKVGPQRFKLGIMQQFPWFGKLKLKGKKRLELSKARRQQIERTKLALFFRVKTVYYDLYYVLKSIDILDKNIRLLKSLNEQMTTMYSTGTLTHGNLIRVQIELAQLEDRKIGLKAKLPSLYLSFNTLLNREGDAVVRVIENLRNDSLRIDNKRLLTQMNMSNPGIKIVSHLEKSERANVALANKNYYPDIGLGIDWINIGSLPVQNLPDNGKNPLALKMSLKIPIRLKRVKAQVAEAAYRLKSIKYKKRALENRLQSELAAATYSFEEAARGIRLYRDSLIPKTREALAVVETSFTTGKSSFSEYIDVQRMLLNFDLKLEKAKRDQYKGLALVEKIIGKPLKPEKI